MILSMYFLSLIIYGFEINHFVIYTNQNYLLTYLLCVYI